MVIWELVLQIQTHELSVQGISTFTGNAHFDGNVTILGILSLTLVSATLTGDVKNIASDIVLDVSESLLNGNVIHCKWYFYI